MTDAPEPAALHDSAKLLAEFRSELACSMRRAGLSDERLGKRIGFDRTTVNKVRNGLLAPSPQFAQKVKEEFGQALWRLWVAWDAAGPREGAETRTRQRHETEQQAGAIRATVPQPPARKLRTVEFVAWVADRSHLSFQESYDAVVTHVERLEAEAPAVRYGEAYRRGQVTREQLARALVAYYRDTAPGDVGAAFYRACVGGVPLTLSVLVRPGWRDAAVRLATDQERFQLAGPGPLASRLDGAALEAALLRLAQVETSGTVLVDNPLYRLLGIAITGHRLEAVVALADFSSYALTMDLLETELITTLAAGGPQLPGSPDPPHIRARLPLRDVYLPTVNSALTVSDRLCVGGPVALLAVARSGTRRSQGDPDFMLLIQERSARVINVPGKLAVVPKAFHQPSVEAAEEASLSASLERELEEELLGREDLEHLSESSYRRADPFHPDHLSDPMRWLLDRRQTDAYRVECLGFGINMVTGNYEFPCLIVIDDEEWWARYGGQVQANWEIARIRCYSSRDTAGLRALATDPRWSNEGLFAFIEGLRRLAELDTKSRLALPRIDVEA
ncbi:MAG: helix-turn-helix domain-containing protein [Egibacteraceae bacterium]